MLDLEAVDEMEDGVEALDQTRHHGETHPEVESAHPSGPATSRTTSSRSTMKSRMPL